MKFHENTIFHIYNQGNNNQRLFFSNDNYDFFLWKMRAYLLPFGDLLSYCLMPNHFHWLFWVRDIAIPRDDWKKNSEQVERMRREWKRGKQAFRSVGVTDSHTDTRADADTNGSKKKTPETDRLITLNESIGILQRSYTRAINKEQDRSGSLFREKCKAKDGWIDEFVTLRHKKGSSDFRFLQGTDYAYRCLCYIHDNAVDAGLVKRPIDWLYSSARDYQGMREGTICNLKLGEELMNFL